MIKRLHQKMNELNAITREFTPVIIDNNDIKIKIWGNDTISTPSGYIQHLIEQIEGDIFPLFFFTGGYAPYTILRNLFCYLDHISNLQFENNTKSIIKIFNSNKFGCYPYIRNRYSKIGDDLIQLYRHELVHQINPLPKIRNISIDGNINQIILGFCISSEINKAIFNMGVMNFKEMFDFMKSDRNRKYLNHLRSTSDFSCFIVNNFCFLFDVIDYLNNYQEYLQQSKQAEIEFCTNYLSVILENIHKPNTTQPLILDQKFAVKADLDEKEMKDWYQQMREALSKRL